MTKRLFWWFLSMISVFSILLTSCNTTSISNKPTNVITPSISTSATNKQPVSTGTTLPTPITPSKTASPLFTADIITVHSYNNLGADRKAVLFFNNREDYFFKFSCDIRQHDANGNYLSSFNLKSNFVPTKSHFVTMLPDNINMMNGLSINNLTISSVSPKDQPQFINLSISNIHTEITKNYDGKSVTVLAGTLFNTGTGTINLETGASGNGLTPTSITIQILKRSPDGSLTLAGGERPYSSPTGAAAPVPQSPCPMPPPGEKISFYTPLWQDITITDGVHATIDGEITIVAPK